MYVAITLWSQKQIPWDCFSRSIQSTLGSLTAGPRSKNSHDCMVSAP